MESQQAHKGQVKRWDTSSTLSFSLAKPRHDQQLVCCQACKWGRAGELEAASRGYCVCCPWKRAIELLMLCRLNPGW